VASARSTASRQPLPASKGRAVKSLLRRIEPWVKRRDAARIVRFLQLCAANPRAGQRMPTGYVVPPYNTRVASILLGVVAEQRARNSMWRPVLGAARAMLGA